jgi:hypothetical protein
LVAVESDTSSKYTFCIQALTLLNNNWVAMKDKEGKPYFIYLQVDDFFELENLKVLDYNWVSKL